MVGYQFISFPRRSKKFVFVFIGALLLYVCLVIPNPNTMPTHYAMSSLQSRRFWGDVRLFVMGCHFGSTQSVEDLSPSPSPTTISYWPPLKFS